MGVLLFGRAALRLLEGGAVSAGRCAACGQFSGRQSTTRTRWAASEGGDLVVVAAVAAAALVIACPLGNLCVASGAAVLQVPEEQSVSFRGSTMTGISNQTWLEYCVTDIPPFRQTTRTRTINALAPAVVLARRPDHTRLDAVNGAGRRKFVRMVVNLKERLDGNHCRNRTPGDARRQ